MAGARARKRCAPVAPSRQLARAARAERGPQLAAAGRRRARGGSLLQVEEPCELAEFRPLRRTSGVRRRRPRGIHVVRAHHRLDKQLRWASTV